MTRLVNEAAPVGAGLLCPAQPHLGDRDGPCHPLPCLIPVLPSSCPAFCNTSPLLPLHPGVLLAGQDTQQELGRSSSSSALLFGGLFTLQRAAAAACRSPARCLADAGTNNPCAVVVC